MGQFIKRLIEFSHRSKTTLPTIYDAYAKTERCKAKFTMTLSWKSSSATWNSTAVTLPHSSDLQRRSHLNG